MESQTPNPTDIKDIIYHWVNQGNNVQKLVRAYEMKGGWESWAQVEIAYLIQEKYDHYTVTREDTIYKDSQKRSDLLLVRQDKNAPREIIELKCQGLRKDATFGDVALVKEVLTDVAKLEKELKSEYLPATAYAFGIGCTKKAWDEVRKDANWGAKRWTGQLCWSRSDEPKWAIFAFWVVADIPKPH